MKIDLHNHSTHSDGKLSVDALVKIAYEHNVKIMALTDHDSVYGCTEAVAEGKKLGVRVLPGIELSTRYKGESIHIIGLFKNGKVPSDMLKFSDETKLIRKERAIKMMEKIRDIYNLKIDLNELQTREVITRGNMFQNLILCNPDADKSIIDLAVSHKSEAYIEVARMNPVEGIDFLKRNNCITILAHPTLSPRNIIEEIIGCGFDGIECLYPANQNDDEAYFRMLAQKNNLFVSAGSDYHGDIKHAMIGTVSLTKEEFDIIEKKLGDK